MGEISCTIKYSTDWNETLYAWVMDIEGFNKQELVKVFDYLHAKESEA